MIPKGSFQAPGYPFTSIIGLVFLVLVLVGLAISGWQSSPYFLHKTSFLVVVFGIPVLAGVLALAWRAVKPKVVANTGNKIEALWTLDGPRYSDVSARRPRPQRRRRGRLNPIDEKGERRCVNMQRRIARTAPWPD